MAFRDKTPGMGACAATDTASQNGLGNHRAGTIQVCHCLARGSEPAPPGTEGVW